MVSLSLNKGLCVLTIHCAAGFADPPIRFTVTPVSSQSCFTPRDGFAIETTHNWEKTLQYFITKFLKHTIAVIVFAVLATGCVTQSANPSSSLVARVDQSKDGRISKEE